MSSWLGRGRILLLLVAACTACAVYLFFPTDESRIKGLFREGAKAFESKNIDRVMSIVSFNYRDEYGMTYLSIREFMKRELVAISDIEVEYDVPEIRVEGKRAEAVLNVRVTATSGNETGYIFGDIRNPLRLRFTLEKELTGWLIVKTDRLEGAA